VPTKKIKGLQVTILVIPFLLVACGEWCLYSRADGLRNRCRWFEKNRRRN